MAISDLIPNLWAAAFLKKVEEQSVYMQVVNTLYEGQLRTRGGNTVKVPDFSKTVTIRDYAIGTNLEAAEAADGSTVDLVINKQKYFHIKVDDINAAQAAPNILAEFVDRAAKTAVLQIDSDIMAEIAGSYALARANASALPLITTDPSDVTALLRALTNIKRRMTEADIPLAGRWILMHPQIIEHLENYYAVAGYEQNSSAEVAQFTPATSDATTRAGFAGTLLGFNVFQTKRIPTSGSGANKEWRCPMGFGRSAVTHAGQITTVEALRSETQFADVVRGLYVYGTKTLIPGEIFWLRVDDTAVSS